MFKLSFLSPLHDCCIKPNSTFQRSTLFSLSDSHQVPILYHSHRILQFIFRNFCILLQIRVLLYLFVTSSPEFIQIYPYLANILYYLSPWASPIISVLSWGLLIVSLFLPTLLSTGFREKKWKEAIIPPPVLFCILKYHFNY